MNLRSLGDPSPHIDASPNLVEVHMGIASKDEVVPWPDTNEVIDLPILGRLYVSRSEVFRHIRAQALQELGFFFPAVRRSVVVGHLQSLLSRSSCTIRSLCLSQNSCAETTMAILQSIPSLVDVRIIISSSKDKQGTEELMKILTVSDVGAKALIS
ncbi:hypothetical protein K438DRAFT_1752692 [Mycena galopus ATCC 62051]|nr:hypothetical protein K438DRAFT_1752692 [Mycena galopus ATCC 62051]